MSNKRPVTKLTGDNAGILRLKIGRIHVRTPLKAVFRQCRPSNMREAPVGLRRGWVKFVADTRAENCRMHEIAMFRGS